MLFTALDTPRLLLKNIDRTDRSFIFDQFSDQVINQYLFDAEPMLDIGEADRLIDFYTKPEPRAQHRWIIIQKSDGKKMGTCGFHCWNKETGSVEIGYDLNRDFWGKGYMVEALTRIIEFAKCEMGVKVISACIYTENMKSIHLVEKLGFVLSGSRFERFRNEKYLHGIYSLKLV